LRGRGSGAAPGQMLTDWLAEQQKVAGNHLESVKSCLTLLEHTTRLMSLAEGDIRGLDAAAETVEERSLPRRGRGRGPARGLNAGASAQGTRARLGRAR
jgi:hypothetical protein